MHVSRLQEEGGEPGKNPQRHGEKLLAVRVFYNLSGSLLTFSRRVELKKGSEVPRQCKQDLGMLPHLCWSGCGFHSPRLDAAQQPGTVNLPAEFQRRPPGLAASRRRFLMLTPPGVSLVEVPKPGAVEERVEARRGTGGMARDGMSFTNDRKSEDLQQDHNRLTTTEKIDQDLLCSVCVCVSVCEREREISNGKNQY